MEKKTHSVHNPSLTPVKVKPPGREDDGVSDMRSLSGGERSFSTVCFMLSLWEITESPFRCLDEFDVYMVSSDKRYNKRLEISDTQWGFDSLWWSSHIDFFMTQDMHNRRISLDLLLELSERQHLRQFIFITPLTTRWRLAFLMCSYSTWLGRLSFTELCVCRVWQFKDVLTFVCLRCKVVFVFFFP